MTTISTTRTDALSELRARVRGTVATAGQDGYELATPWNVAIPVQPLAVIAVADAQDVAETVRCAAAHGLRVAVQRTGHGTLPIAGDDVLLIHTAGLDELSVDPVARTARAGAGIVWQQLIETAAPFGLAPPAGSAPGVGVAGFLTGGGIGPLVRTFGVSSDYVRALDVVTGDGRLVRATAEENGELFWGMRGGKSTLGVVCAVELELPELAELYGGAVFFDGADAHAVVRGWAAWTATLPETATTSLALLQLPPLPQIPPPLAGRYTLAVRFACVEDEPTAAALLAPIRTAAEPILDTAATMPYAAIGMIHADPPDPMPAHEDGALLHTFDEATVDALLSTAGPESGSPQTIVELRHLGGALAREPEHGSAVCHRDAAFTLMTIGVLAPEIAAHVAPHAAGLVEALSPWTTGGIMPNFGGAAALARGAQRYDESTRAWLSALSERHDPAGVLVG